MLKELQLTETTDQIRAATQRLYQELIDAEATAFIGAAPWQRSDERTRGLPRVRLTVRGCDSQAASAAR